MKNLNTKKIIVSGMLVAVTVSLSGFSIPISASRCFPVQHMINVIAGVFLGPVYGVGMAFCTSLIRNIMGTGSLLAFPGSMVGACLTALMFRYTGKLAFAYGGEVIGTGIMGAICCYPIAVFMLGKQIALFAYVIPFMMSTLCGVLMAAVLMGILYQSGVFKYLNRVLE